MLELSLKILISYLLGSVNGSLVIGRLYGGVDIRDEGSGNPGGTNALRTHGLLFALWVVLIDVGKGFLAAAWIPALTFLGLSQDPAVAHDWLAAGCAAAAIVGHNYPVWFAFRGGKGAATFVGALLGLAPVLLVPVVAVWVTVLVITGYVGLATICGAAAAPIYLFLVGTGSDALRAFAVAMALFILFSHRSNLQRIRTGTEHRAKRAMLFKR